MRYVTANGLENALRKNRQKEQNLNEIQSRLVKKKTILRKQLFAQTPFSHSTSNGEYFRRKSIWHSQNPHSNLASKIIKLCQHNSKIELGEPKNKLGV